MEHRMYDDLIAIAGGIFGWISTVYLQANFHEFMNAAPWKLLMTLSAGVLGGAAGIAGKELVYFIKRKLKKKI